MLFNSVFELNMNMGLYEGKRIGGNLYVVYGVYSDSISEVCSI